MSTTASSTSQILTAGTPAPDFTLRATPDQTLTLSELRGQPVVLVFYPADWSAVCGDELNVFNAALPLFRKKDAVVLGISVDSVWSHQAFIKDRNLHVDLLSDFEPKGEVSRRYGAYDSRAGSSERAIFLVGPDGTIVWSHLSGTFWQAHDLLFEYQDELGPQLYARICDSLGLSTSSLEHAMRTERYASRIDNDLEGGIRSGVNGTPTFFVDGVRLDGGIGELEQAVASALAG